MIKLVISGKSKSGRSTLGIVLKEALSGFGLDVVLLDPEMSVEGLKMRSEHAHEILKGKKVLIYANVRNK